MWKALGVFGVGGRHEKKELNASESEWCSSCDSDSSSSFHSAEPGVDEVDNSHGPTTESDSEISTGFDGTPGVAALRGGMCVNYYGHNESDSAASTSSRPSRRNARAESHRKQHSRRSVQYSIPGIREGPLDLDAVVSRSRELRLDDELLVRPREFRFDNEVLDPADRLQSGLQSSRSSRRAVAPGRLRGGYQFPKIQSDEIPFSSGIVDLKVIQLQKLHSLYRLDKDWGYVNSEKREPLFSWPWKTLTEQQVALGKLEFKKFIVVLSTCQGWHIQPEDVLTMDQIGTLHQIPVEEIEGYLNHEIAVSKGVQNDRVLYIKHSWLRRDQRVSYECHVDRTGSYIIKLVQPKGTSTLLDRRFGEDRIMPVFINEKPDDAPMFAQTGIIVGLRRYRLWTYKNSGKDDFLKNNESKDVDYQRSVRCYYICTESLADVDLDDPNFMYFVNIQAARCHILHINTATAIHKYASRLQLPLSKSLTADIDLRTMDDIKEIDDLLCKTLDENGKAMSHTDGTGEISPEVAKMLPASVFKGKVDNREGYPTLVQMRMFWEGMGIKGTFLVNHKLDKKRIHYRRSMVKVERSRDLRGFQSVNALEVLTTSREPKEAHLSQDLIVLLSLGNVPAAFFLSLMKTALDNIQNLFTDRNLAIKEVKGCTAEYGARDQTLRMLIASIPLTNLHLQKNLRQISLDKMKNLRRGCIPLPKSRYLMGTCDPTKERILKRHQVAIAMGDGKICGKVLVYKNPGKHYGDVHLFDAVWDERLDPYVGPSKYTIFFPTVGDRPIVDEIANSDLDGDLYWVCNNAELISLFKPNLPWERPTGIVKTPTAKSPSQMSPNELEVALLERFLKIRFSNGKSPSMPLAASYWLAHMDQYLSLREAVHPPPEMGLVKEKIDELINIFYKALDAEKSGNEVLLPYRLRPDTWPHFMKKLHLNNRKHYHSTSILGQLHDMASMDAKDFGHPDGDTLDYDPKFEFEGFENYIEKWRTLFKQYNEEMRTENRTDEKTLSTDQDREKISRVISKYQEILKGEGKPLHQIWEEASALYYVNYEHACRYVGSRFAPSMFGAFAIGGTYLCEIYSRKEGVDPYVYAPSVRLDMLRA